MMPETALSVVILTYNRPELIEKQLDHFSRISDANIELIIVDNCSDEPLDQIVENYEFARLIRTESNLGISARNLGILAAKNEIVITLDDDVTGITGQDIDYLTKLFSNEMLAAVCFKVLDEITKEIINWCHHRKVEIFSDKEFLTDEISEGAVAFRKDDVIQAGLYPEYFFISHEGPDLAIRLMNLGKQVIYTPAIKVKHSHSPLGRPSWRRYYYDTRNLIWLVIRNYQFLSGLKRLCVGLGAMFIYSIRDGFVGYWVKGIFDGVKAAPRVFNDRTPMSPSTLEMLNRIKIYRPGLVYMLRKRIRKKAVGI